MVEFSPPQCVGRVKDIVWIQLFLPCVVEEPSCILNMACKFFCLHLENILIGDDRGIPNGTIVIFLKGLKLKRVNIKLQVFHWVLSLNIMGNRTM